MLTDGDLEGSEGRLSSTTGGAGGVRRVFRELITDGDSSGSQPVPQRHFRERPGGAGGAFMPGPDVLCKEVGTNQLPCDRGENDESSLTEDDLFLPPRKRDAGGAIW